MDAALVELLVTLEEKRPVLARTLRPSIESATESEILRSIAAPFSQNTVTIDPITLPRREGRDVGIIMLGCGRGAVARRLATELRASAPSSTLIILETDAHRFLATLLVDEWTDLLADPRVRFAIGSYPDTALREAAPPPADPVLDFALGGLAMIPGDEPAHAGAIRNALQTVAGTALTRFQSQSRQTRREAAQKIRTGLPSGPWNLFSSVSEQTTALKTLAPSIIAAARRAGHHGTTHLQDDADPFRDSKALRAALEADIDLVLSFLRPGGNVVSWLKGIPSLVLVSSHPHLLPIETFDWTDQDLVVVTDPTFASAYRSLGITPEIRPLATDIPDETAMDSVVHPPCDVLSVGSIPSAARVVEGLPPQLAELIESLAADWVRHPRTTAEELISTTNIRGDERVMNAVRLALGYAATRIRRIASVVSLAQAGFNVRVHGGADWAAALRGTAAEGCWQGWLPAGPTQSAAFRDAGVVINVNSFATPGMLNMRSFDVPAAGGILVCDDRPALHQAFQVGVEALSFGRIEELPDLVSGVLAAGSRREAIGLAGRKKVERSHSWDSWWTWAESRLRERFPPRDGG